MKKLFIYLLIYLLIIFYGENLYAQVTSEFIVEDLAEQLFLNGEEEEIFPESYLEDLLEIRRDPYNLNTITKEQLNVFPFLSDDQVENILYYLYVHGSMQTIYELQLIKGMDYATIQLLLPFVCVKEVEKKSTFPLLKTLLKHGKQEIITRVDIPFNKKAGYHSYSDSVLLANPNKKYLGSPFYHSFRYSYHYKDQLWFGLTAEKDAGEPFFTGYNKKGYDYYSFYFLLRNVGNWKSIAVGNYRLNFGLGLIMNTDYSLGKTSTLSTIGYKAGTIKKHSSTDEYNYFRGVAASYQLQRLTFTAFYSHRTVDAIVDNELITSFKKDGLHRVERDFEKRNTANIQLIGGNILYEKSSFRISSTTVYNFFNKMFIPEIKPYSVYNLSGQYFFNSSIDYRYRWKQITFFGETAIDQSGGVATLNVLRITPVPDYQLLLLHRYYGKDYNALYGRSFSENSQVKNETGFYIGLEGKPLRYWKFMVYGDFFTFPWLKYGVDRPSSGFDGLIQLTYSPKKNVSMFGRYRYKTKDKNYREEETDIKIVCPYNQHKLRYQLNYQLKTNLAFRTTIDYTIAFPEGHSKSKGFMLTQAFSYQFMDYPFLIDFNYGIFDTDDYSSRLSIYEKGVLYSFSVPSFYGKGVRTALNFRYTINSSLTAILKVAQTRYVDREQIGSGLEQIEGNRKSDLYMQFRCKF